MKSFFLLITFTLLLASNLCPAAEFSEQPFSEKLIFSETPEIGRNWRVGLRSTDLLGLEGYWNINGWMTVDLFTLTLPTIEDKKSATQISESFKIFTIKSRPLALTLKGRPYKLAGGIKFFRSEFLHTIEGDAFYDINDKSTALFLTQGYLLNERHYFNLFTSLSSHAGQTDATYFLIPGYRFGFGQHWSFGIEYYMTNTRYLPMKFMQEAFGSNNWILENMNRDMYSFMMYGFQYTGEHVRVDLNLTNHISFQNFILPMIGFGWNF